MVNTLCVIYTIYQCTAFQVQYVGKEFTGFKILSKEKTFIYSDQS